MDDKQTQELTRRSIIASLPLTTAPIGSAALIGSEHQALAAPRAPRIVALEEHVMLPEFLGYFAKTKQNIRTDLFGKVLPLLAGLRR